jgi:hypothetical protein
MAKGLNVRNESQVRTCFSEEDVCHLADSLSEYALALPEREKRILFEMLLQAMAPLDRFLYVRTSDLLSSDEQALLRSLEKKSRKR